jgi:hypothetical protein
VVSINAILYNLNGYAVDIINTANEIAGYYDDYAESGAITPEVILDEAGLPYLAMNGGDIAARPQPADVDWGNGPGQTEAAVQPGPIQKPDLGMPSFEALFKQKR